MSGEPKGWRDFGLALAALQANFRAVAWVVLIGWFAEALSTLAFGAAPGSAVAFVTQALIMFAVMRTLLSGGEVAGLRALQTVNRGFPGQFVVRLLLLAIPGVVALVLVSGIVYPFQGRGAAIFAGLTVLLVTQTAVLALFGTMLPRIAEGKPGRATRAMERAEGNFRPVFLALLTGPVFVDLAAKVAGLMVETAGLPAQTVVPGWHHLSVVGTVLDIGFRVVSAVTAAFYAAVLTRVYLDQRRPDPGPRSR